MGESKGEYLKKVSGQAKGKERGKVRCDKERGRGSESLGSIKDACSLCYKVGVVRKQLMSGGDDDDSSGGEREWEGMRGRESKVRRKEEYEGSRRRKIQEIR